MTVETEKKKKKKSKKKLAPGEQDKKKEKKKKRKSEEKTSGKRKASKKSRKEDASKTHRRDDETIVVPTTKENGIITASLEDTNKLRAKLGLKPLKPRSKPAPPPDMAEESPIEARKRMEERKVIRRKKRHMGLTISQEHAADDGYGSGSDDIMAWITKSRKQEMKKAREEAAKREKMFSDEDEEEEAMAVQGASVYSSKDLQGMKVAHDSTQLKAGDQKILVLKDTGVLDEKGNLNEAEDELMNMDLRARDVEERNKARRGNTGLTYDPYGDKVNSLLPQYDEEMPDRMGFRLNKQGAKNATAADVVLTKLDSAMKVDLFSEVKYQTDTYTPEEMSQMFRKRKTKTKKKKTKRKKPNLEAIPIELREEMNESDKLRAARPFEERYEFLQKVETTSTDRGKRGADGGSLAVLKQKLADSKADQQRKFNYKKALEKAEANEWLLTAVEAEEERDDHQFRTNLRKLEESAASSSNKKEESLQKTLARIKKTKAKKNLVRKTEKKDEGLSFTTANVFAFGLRGAVQELNRYDQFSEDEDDPLKQELQVKEEPVVKLEETLGSGSKKKKGPVREKASYEVTFKSKPFGLIPSPGGSFGGRGYKVIDIKKNSEARLHAVKKGSMLTHIDGKYIEDWVFSEIRLLLRRAELPCTLKFKWDDANVLEEGKPLIGRSIVDTLKFIGARGILEDDEYNVFAGARTDQAKPVDVARKLNQEYLKWTTEDVCKWLEKSDQPKLVRTIKDHKLTGRKMHWLNRDYCRKVLKLRSKETEKLLTEFNLLQGDAAPDLTLEYPDPNTGKPMTAKAAFRNMCHQFHGKKPGKRKMDKRMRRRAEESSRKIRGSVDTPLGTLAMITQATRTSGKAYVVVDGPESKAGFKNAASNFLDYVDIKK